MATHKCVNCKWFYALEDSSNRLIYLCIFDQSESYLQEVGYCTEDCELDDYAEEIWREENDRIH